jgi:histidinol-phosphate aminotransferase
MRPSVRDDLKALEGYHSPQVPARIRLNTNEAPSAPPASWAAEYADAITKVQWHRYPDRQYTRLRTKLAELHQVSPEQIFVANGSNEVIQTLLLTFAGAGRTVLTVEPTYAVHQHLSRISGADVVEIDRGSDFAVDAEELLDAQDRHHPDVTFLCSPNNPTGLSESRSTVEQVLARQSGLLVMDEAYGQFASWSAEVLVAEDTPMVVTRTFSKTWAMAGLRLGYLIGPAWLVGELDKVVLPYHLDVGKLIAGELALNHVAEADAQVAAIKSERDRLIVELATLNVDVWRSEANFVLFRPREFDGDTVWQGLVDRDVLVRNCSHWPRLTNCLRVTVGTPADNNVFLSALSDIVGRSATYSPV